MLSVKRLYDIFRFGSGYKDFLSSSFLLGVIKSQLANDKINCQTLFVWYVACPGGLISNFWLLYFVHLEQWLANLRRYGTI